MLYSVRRRKGPLHRGSEIYQKPFKKDALEVAIAAVIGVEKDPT
jgi:hypothetical protein